MEAPQTGQAGRSFEPKFLPFSTRTGAVLALAEFVYRRFVVVARQASKGAPVFVCRFGARQNIGTPQIGHRRWPIGGGEDGSKLFGCGMGHPLPGTGGSAISLSVTGAPVGTALVGDDLS